jgi:hypothetical protein
VYNPLVVLFTKSATFPSVRRKCGVENSFIRKELATKFQYAIAKVHARSRSVSLGIAETQKRATKKNLAIGEDKSTPSLSEKWGC